MRLPPRLARVHIERRTRCFQFWVPLVLLGLLSLVLLAPLARVGSALPVVVAPRSALLPLALGLYTVPCESHGGEINLEGTRERVSILLH